MVTLAEFDLSGRVALVTGGGTGIGRATALLLAERGADVAIAGRRPEKLEPAAEEIRTLGRRALCVPADVRLAEQAPLLIERVIAEFGRLDILVNNAGGAGSHTPLARLDPARWDRDVQLNLNAAMYLSQAALPHLRQTRGNVVNISSMAGINGTKGVAAYSAAKAGVQMLTRVSAAEWGHYGVRVNCVAPGMTATEKAREGWDKSGFDAPGVARHSFALRRYGETREVAQMIVFFASDAASYITGETVAVGGGVPLGGMIDTDD
ncbi:MAG: SDR family NAD(P)-dependent oxidoreductase [Novosphingobium sp.]